ncbi:MAG: SLC45 family MFS transporter [Tissierellia bacterium]|nr:SLC45 family MFS transporter [Tissierellia bacterium]
MKLDMKKTFILGLGFFGINLLWPVYNAFVPIMLEQYTTKATLIGLIMTIDNLFAVIFQPIFGAMSDRTKSRFGRRMPYILIGMPISALLFSLIPYTNSLATLMITIIIMNFMMSVYRAPTVALMPDITPSPLRSKANGIINFMGGLAAVIAYLFGGLLYRTNPSYPFHLSTVVMLMALFILFVFIKENTDFTVEKKKTKEKNKDVGKTRSLVFLLLAVFFWFSGYNAVETFFSLYAQYVLNIDPSNASILLSIFSASFLVFAIPSGYIGTKFGRRKTILTGVTGVFLTFTPLIFIKTVPLISVLFVLGGFFWALININSYPMVVEIAPKNGVGAYTGYYYFFSASSAVLSPILFGFIKDIIGSYGILFFYSVIAFAIALFCMTFVKHGDVELDEEKKLALEINN